MATKKAREQIMRDIKSGRLNVGSVQDLKGVDIDDLKKKMRR